MAVNRGENTTLFDFTDTDSESDGDSDPVSDTDTTADSADRDRPTAAEVLAEPVDLTIKDGARDPEPETEAEDEPVDEGEDGDEDDIDLSDVPFGEIDVSFNIEPEEGETESESEVGGECEDEGEDEDESDGVGDVEAGEDDDDDQLVDISELPKWLDSDDIPPGPRFEDPGWSWDLTRPDRCQYCGARGPWDEPLERGEYKVDWEPCPPSHAGATSRYRQPCDCCACPGCGNTSFYYRKTKEPRFKCHNSNCGETFDDAVPVPPDFDEWHRTLLYWSCFQCEKPVLSVAEGLSSAYLPDYYP